MADGNDSIPIVDGTLMNGHSKMGTRAVTLWLLCASCSAPIGSSPTDELAGDVGSSLADTLSEDETTGVDVSETAEDAEALGPLAASPPSLASAISSSQFFLATIELTNTSPGELGIESFELTGEVPKVSVESNGLPSVQVGQGVASWAQAIPGNGSLRIRILVSGEDFKLAAGTQAAAFEGVLRCSYHAAESAAWVLEIPIRVKVFK